MRCLPLSSYSPAFLVSHTPVVEGCPLRNSTRRLRQAADLDNRLVFSPHPPYVTLRVLSHSLSLVFAVLSLFIFSFRSLVSPTTGYPFDVARRRIQVADLAYGKQRFWSRGATRNAFREAFAARGFRGLYAGCALNFLKQLPSISASFVAFEAVKQWLSTPARSVVDTV